MRPAALVFAFVLTLVPTGILQAQQTGASPTAPPAASAGQSSAPAADSSAPSSATPAPAPPATAPQPSTSPSKPPAAATAAPAPHVPGRISKADRERALGMLDETMKGIQENYWDPNLKGVNWEAVHTQAKEKIEESNSLGAALAQVAAAVATLNDGHTRFIPPYKPFKLDFGLEYRIIWSRCFIIRVRPGSDAAAKNVRPGAEILSLDGIKPTRQNWLDTDYLLTVLDPREEMNLELLYPSGEKQTVTIKPKILLHSAMSARFGGGQWNDMHRQDDNERHRLRIQVAHVGDIAIVYFPEFAYDVDDLQSMRKKIGNASTAIIDLRGDPGGYVVTLKWFTGMFFDHDVKIDDQVERKKTEPEKAQAQHFMNYPGKLIVLVDSASTSASEAFARVIQLEKRGTVIGDISGGYLMTARWFPFFSSGLDYGASISISNVVMSDGKVVEHKGVKPDDIQFPQPTDIESGRDPVLAHAVEVAGGKMTPEEAGKLFPYEWPLLQ
jgi:carboxyl-terminal processing protease